MKDWMRRLRGLNDAAITRVEATTARVDFSPVRTTKTLCNMMMPPKYIMAKVELPDVGE
jgi:hypothetical protein